MSHKILTHTGSLVRRAQQRHVALWLRDVSTEITSVQYAALLVLDQRPGASQRELGDELDLDRSTIADLAARMVRHGLLERVQDPDDKRRNTLYLSDHGREQLALLRPRVDGLDAVLTEGLQVEERDQLRDLLERLLAAEL